MKLEAEDAIKVYCNVIGDDNSHEYIRCINLLSSTSLKIFEYREITQPEGFLKKDKIVNSPSSALLTEFKPQVPNQTEFKVLEYEFERIFNEGESIDTVSSTILPDISKNACIISVGKSDLFTFRTGMIVKTIIEAFEQSFAVKTSVASLTQEKTCSVLGSFASLNDYTDIAHKLFSLDYFNPRKPKDDIYVTTAIFTKDRKKICIQFVDIIQFSKSVDSLSKVLTNDIFERDGNYHAKDRLVQMLCKTLCFSPKIIVIGNVYPTLPFFIQSRHILMFIDNIFQNRNKKRSTFSCLLLKEVKKLQKSKIQAGKLNEEYCSQITLLKEQLESQASQCNEKNLKYERELEKLKEVHEVQEVPQGFVVDAEMSIIRYRLDEKNSEIDKINAEKQFINEKNEENIGIIKDYEAKIENLKAKLMNAEKFNVDIREKMEKLEKNADYTWNYIKEKEAEMKQLKNLVTQFENQINSNKIKISELEDTKFKLENELNSKSIPEAFNGDFGAYLEDLHTQFYEFIVAFYRVYMNHLGKNREALIEAENELNNFQLRFSDREDELINTVKEINEYYLNKIDDMENEYGENQNNLLNRAKEAEAKEKAFQQELENIQKSMSTMKKDFEKKSDESRADFHNFKKKVKAKIREKQSEFDKRLEELTEQNKQLQNEKSKLLLEKNKLVENEIELKSGYDFIIKDVKETYSKEIKKLQEQIEILKAMRDPKKPRKNNQ